jgi:hypothetical protein
MPLASSDSISQFNSPIPNMCMSNGHSDVECAFSLGYSYEPELRHSYEKSQDHLDTMALLSS